MRNPRMIQRSAIGIAVAVVAAALGFMAFAADSSSTDTKPAAVDAEQYADIFGNEVFDIQDLAEGAEIQRRMFNRITPPGFSWLQPMFPSVVPFDATNFDDSFLDDLLGEDKNSVAIYPLSLALDPKTRETLVYNADGKLIATIPSDKIVRCWPEDADPARVTLQLDLLPSEDVEPYLYTESRVDESIASTSSKSAKSGGPAMKSLGTNEFGICNIQKLTNGNIRLTVTNGTDIAEVFAYTVLHTSSVVVVTWTNEESNVVTDTNTVWTPVSPPFNGIESEWASATNNLPLTNGVGVWEDANISSNDRVRFYATTKRGDADEDELTDGAEIFLHRTDMSDYDTDGDYLLDGYDIVLDELDTRYALWASNGVIYVENHRLRTFKGELSIGTDPLNNDTDSDTLPDGWEVQYEIDPFDDGTTNSNNGATGDPDGDGFSNELELELGAPADNSAWNGNELAYRLTHAHTVTNSRSITTNLIGMRVDIDISSDCGGSAGTQNKTDDLVVPDLLEYGYYINITVTGLVEDVSNKYDEVTFEAFTNTFYFKGHNNGNPECRMVGDVAMRNVLIFANSTVKLRYNTVSYKWHDGAYAEIIDATNICIYSIYLDHDLWWFNGEDPGGGYNITATLTAQPETIGTFKWDVISGASKIDLNNGGADADSITAIDDNSITVKSTAPSASATNVTKDVTIQLTYNGTVVGSYDLAVFSPNSLNYLGTIDHDYSALPPPYQILPGYWCEVFYEILDQFGDVLPHNVPWNEDFNKDGSISVSGVNDYPGGDDWGWGPESGWSVPPAAAIDNLARCDPPCSTPPAQNVAVGSVKVDHEIGAWYIGSTTIGNGVLVKDNCKWQMYQDHARHE